MEPLFFKAENALPGCSHYVAGFGFNGAAFFQSGKSAPTSANPFIPAEGFNGAAFFQSGKSARTG